MESKVIIPKMKNITTLTEHTGEVCSILLLSDERLASCSEDKTIKIFNPKNNYHCDITLTGHSSKVNNICQLPNGKLVSCSNDKSIKIWKISESLFECEYTITNAHNQEIICIIPLTNDRMTSCSDDKTVKIWNSKDPYDLIQTLIGHTRYITSIIQAKQKDIIISGSWDNTLRIWDASSYKSEVL